VEDPLISEEHNNIEVNEESLQKYPPISSFSNQASSFLSVVEQMQDISLSVTGFSISSENVLEDIGYLSPLPVETASRCFKIIYISNLTCTATQALAEGDLAFLKTKILQQEYNSTKHLVESIHLVSQMQNQQICIVYIQEWVSKLYLYTKITQQFTFYRASHYAQLSLLCQENKKVKTIYCTISNMKQISSDNTLSSR
jgi:hypothetical protein